MSNLYISLETASLDPENKEIKFLAQRQIQSCGILMLSDNYGFQKSARLSDEVEILNTLGKILNNSNDERPIVLYGLDDRIIIERSASRGGQIPWLSWPEENQNFVNLSSSLGRKDRSSKLPFDVASDLMGIPSVYDSAGEYCEQLVERQCAALALYHIAIQHATGAITTKIYTSLMESMLKVFSDVQNYEPWMKKFDESRMNRLLLR